MHTGGRFPDRLAVIGVVVKLQADLNHTILEWARRALATVDEWPNDLRQAPLAQGALDEIRRRGEVLGPRRGIPQSATGPTRPIYPNRPDKPSPAVKAFKVNGCNRTDRRCPSSPGIGSNSASRHHLER